MEFSEKKEFMQLLAETLASYGKALPEGSILTAWWSNLAGYPIAVVRAAFQAYCSENGEFAPLPAGIAMRCRKTDGRPEAEEAWASALTALDEMSTVVWTTETAEAFNLCRPVLISSNAISARPSFLAAYTRLVAEARSKRRPLKVVVSLGSNKHHQTSVIQRAVENGLLPSPSASALLKGPACDSPPTTEGRAQLAKIKKQMADAAEKKEQARLHAVELERLAYEEFNRKTEEKIRNYLEVTKTFGGLKNQLQCRS